MSKEVSEALLARARRIRLLVLDCDGVLTDGRVILLPDGQETKFFDVKDGHGIRLAKRAGLAIAVISGRASFAVRERARDLEIDYLYESAWTKLGPYEELISRTGLDDADVCYVGDDVTDLPLLRRTGLAVAVADAVREVREQSHFVTARAGGRGAVREVVELILKAQGKWDEVMRRYLD